MHPYSAIRGRVTVPFLHSPPHVTGTFRPYTYTVALRLSIQSYVLITMLVIRLILHLAIRNGPLSLHGDAHFLVLLFHIHLPV